MLRLIVLIGCLTSVVTSTFWCTHGSVPMEGDPNSCYSLVDTPLSQPDAKARCGSFVHGVSVLATPFTPAEARHLLDFAISLGLPTDGESGLWTEFKRSTAAPLSGDGDLDPAAASVRNDPSEWEAMSYGNRKMPEDMWRNDTAPSKVQPGDKVIADQSIYKMIRKSEMERGDEEVDQRDEQCAAIKNPGTVTDPVRLDSYECEGATKHYALCKIPLSAV